MNREQAVNIVKEIFLACYGIEGKSWKLLQSQEDSYLSHTFQIHIKLPEYTNTKGYAADIAKKYNLDVKEIDGWLIVYKPYPSVKSHEER